MNQPSFRKDFPEFGTVEYRIASSRKDFEGAFKLIYREYLLRGFILKEHYKSNMRITPYNLVPGATVFVALINNEVVATNAIVPDTAFGLPLDMGYSEEADSLRKQHRKISEGGYLAIKHELFGRGFFSMFNFKKLDFMFTLFKFMFQYALFTETFDDICIVTNPQYMIFKFLPFEIIGPVKYYGYDKVAVKKKAAIFKRVDLAKVRENLGKPHLIFNKRAVLYKIFLEKRLPQEVLTKKYNFSREDIMYFFAEKSDVLQSLNKEQRKYLSGIGMGDILKNKKSS